MSADEILFRCHALNNINAKGRGESFGLTAKKEMRKIWILETKNRFKSLDNKYVSKGNKCEEDGLTLLSRVKKTVFIKNTIRLSNKYITGEPDTFLGKSIYEADETFDTKISWDIQTFYNAVDGGLDADYECQGQGYMVLTGAKKHTVAYCLVNTPLAEIKHELYKEGFAWENNDTPVWVQLQLIANMVYDKLTFDKYIQELGCFPDDENSKAVYDGFVEIPKEERLHEKSFARDDENILQMYNRIKECREYMSAHFF